MYRKVQERSFKGRRDARRLSRGGRRGEGGGLDHDDAASSARSRGGCVHMYVCLYSIDHLKCYFKQAARSRFIIRSVNRMRLKTFLVCI